jgi:plasmid stabilization system protein ParE
MRGLTLEINMNSLFSIINTVVGGGQPEEASQQVLMPWEDYKERAKELNIKGSLTDVMRDEMLEMSGNEDTFLLFKKDKDSDLYDFDMDRNVYLIMKLMEEDPNLPEMFNKLVPRRTTEEYFWKSYFYNIDRIKDHILHKFSQNKTETSAMDELHKELMEELELELIDTPKAVEKKPARASQSSEVRQLRRDLEAALQRIKKLEDMVEVLMKERSSHKAEI